MTELAGQATRESARDSWLDHPTVARHYYARGLLDGLPWDAWVAKRLRRPARRALEIGCGAGQRSLFLFEQALAQTVDGVDVRETLIDEAEQRRGDYGAPGLFRVLDPNTGALHASTYDLIFACHTLHQVVALEHVMEQVYGALTPGGLFVVEGYVGPSRFRWTELQMELVAGVCALLPDQLATFRWNARKTHEGRPAVEALAANAPLNAIRSQEIPALFHRYFDVVAVRTLGGSIQNLLYNGIIHNFSDTDAEDLRRMDAVIRMEDALLDAGRMPSDFRLLIGRRR